MARAWKHRGMTSSSMRIRILPPVLAALLLAACGEPTAPRPLGRFVLTSLDGQPEPFVWFDHTFSSGERRIFTILADTVWLLPDGRRRESGAARRAHSR